MDVDEILEKLSQEERLELLERLVKGAGQAKEENLTIEERVTRLEKMVGIGSNVKVKIMRAGEMSGFCC